MPMLQLQAMTPQAEIRACLYRKVAVLCLCNAAGQCLAFLPEPLHPLTQVLLLQVLSLEYFKCPVVFK